MSSYRSDQFYGGFKEKRGSTDNPPFLYPGGTAPTFTGPDSRKKVDRGYIKSLVGSNSSIWTNLQLDKTNVPNSDAFNSKMWFQFNPSQLLQSVQMSEASMVPILMDAGQLTQPIPGNQTISFDILLDRQMEMQGKTNIQKSNQAERNPEAYSSTPNNVDSSSDPADIGVLADLKVLYGIIGQGLSNDQIQLYNAIAARSKASSTDTSTAASVSAANPPVIPNSSGNINAGNFAFLVPLPVRVLFSSLFMVDGFITSSSILYTKFNANMVPMQCTVTLSMQAVYFGFARQDTLLTQKLSTSTVQTSSSTSTTNAGANGPDAATSSLLNKFISGLGPFSLRVYKKGTNVQFGNSQIKSAVAIVPWSGLGEDSIFNDQQITVVCGFANLATKDLRNKNEFFVWANDSTKGTFNIRYSISIDIYRDAYLASELPSGAPGLTYKQGTYSVKMLSISLSSKDAADGDGNVISSETASNAKDLAILGSANMGNKPMTNLLISDSNHSNLKASSLFLSGSEVGSGKATTYNNYLTNYNGGDSEKGTKYGLVKAELTLTFHVDITPVGATGATTFDFVKTFVNEYSQSSDKASKKLLIQDTSSDRNWDDHLPSQLRWLVNIGPSIPSGSVFGGTPPVSSSPIATPVPPPKSPIKSTPGEVYRS